MIREIYVSSSMISNLDIQVNQWDVTDTVSNGVITLLLYKQRKKKLNYNRQNLRGAFEISKYG